MNKNYQHQLHQMMAKWQNRRMEFMSDLSQEERIMIVMILNKQSNLVEEFLSDLDLLAYIKTQEPELQKFASGPALKIA